MIEELISAISLGFAYGLGPCTLYCAPFIVPFVVATAKGKKEGLVLTLVFSLARVVAYTILGLLTGFIGEQFDFLVSKKLLGLFLVLIGIAVIFKFQGKCIAKSKVKITGPGMAFISGLLYGLGPCPPLLALLGIVAQTGSAVTGALMGLLFGIGTVISPILLLGFFSGWFAKRKEFKEVIPYVTGGFIILLGIILMLGPD